jgi:hypothetical protein
MAVPPCVTPDNKIVATVKMARAMEIRVTFTSRVTDIYVAGELKTSCGETLALEWLKGNPVDIPNPVPRLGPEPTGAPSVPVLSPEAAAPADSQAGAPLPDTGA